MDDDREAGLLQGLHERPRRTDLTSGVRQESLVGFGAAGAACAALSCPLLERCMVEAAR